MGWLLFSRVGGLLAGKCSKLACTLSETGAVPPSSLPLHSISADNCLSSLSKRREVKLGELPRLAARE